MLYPFLPSFFKSFSWISLTFRAFLDRLKTFFYLYSLNNLTRPLLKRSQAPKKHPSTHPHTGRWPSLNLRYPALSGVIRRHPTFLIRRYPTVTFILKWISLESPETMARVMCLSHAAVQKSLSQQIDRWCGNYFAMSCGLSPSGLEINTPNQVKQHYNTPVSKEQGIPMHLERPNTHTSLSNNHYPTQVNK